MLIDAFTEFADAYDAGDAAVQNETVNMGDVIDLGAVTRDVGRGTPLWVVFSVEETFAGASNTYQFRLVTDATETPDVAGNATDHLLSPAFAVGTLASGFKFCMPLPSEGATYERYLGVQLTEGANGAATSAGKVNAFLSLHPVGNETDGGYPDALNND